jgi:DTW domain-containing protein YfiP
MHPKEFKKTKNNTGRLTHLSLKNSELIIGESFEHNRRINALIDNEDHECYVLYPSSESLSLNHAKSLDTKRKNIIFIIDATWSCSKTMLRLSPKLNCVQKMSFTHTKTSQYEIKTQPEAHCLSTIESTLCVLELLNEKSCECIADEQLENFLNPFKEMIAYQISCVEGEGREIRYKKSTQKLII